MDRISLLPDEVIYQILSFLDVFDALGAGLLSKRWGLLCSALPFIDINILELCRQRDLGISSDLFRNFEHLITWMLTSRSAVNIIRLRIRCVRCTGLFSNEQIFRWMCFAARRNVQEFILLAYPSVVLHMPLSFVTGQSLQFLELDLFGQALQFPSYLGFPHLKTLSFKRIIHEDLTRSFFSRCPKLNKLVLCIFAFENIKVLDISSSTIEHLFFESCRDEGYELIDLKISCPKLLAFKYGATMPRKYIFEGMPSLETMHISPYGNGNFDSSVADAAYGVLKTSHKIVDLKLGMHIIEGLFDMGDKFRCECCLFHGLKALNLWIALTDDYMKILSLLLNHCHNLDALTLYLDDKDDEITLTEMVDFSKYTCLKSSIKTIQLVSFNGEEDEIEVARNLLEYGLVLKKFVVYWHPKGMIDDEVVKRILSFPRSSVYGKVMFVDPHLSIDLDAWQKM